MRSEKIALGMVLLSFLMAIYFYPKVPEKMISHWNAQGLPDGFAAKFIGIFAFPFISLFLLVLFRLLPKIDPLRENIEKFKHYYNEFVLVMVYFIFYLQVLSLLQNFGIAFNMVQFMLPAFGLVFYYVGVLVEHSKRNWFIGIRTPWTMSSDEVWAKTHKIGGKLYKFSALITILGFFFVNYAILFILAPILFTSIYIILYSYFEYQKLYKPIKKN